MTVIDGQAGAQPLNGNDARAMLGITWQWIEDANNGLGSDVGDLMARLERAGYGPPDKDEAPGPQYRDAEDVELRDRCQGAEGNCTWRGRCTGRETTCQCCCPACCGDTPEVWGYEGDR